MANKGYDELADFDPAAPPKGKSKNSAPDPDAPAKTTRNLIVLCLCVCVLGGVLWYYFGPKPAPKGLVGYTAGSAAISLVGPEVEALGGLEGPYVVMQVLSPSRVTIGGQNHPEEAIELVGLDATDYVPQARLVMLKPEELAEREKQLEAMNAYRSDALKKYCGLNTHYILRLGPAGPNQPSPAYLIQRDTSQPDTRGILVNAHLVRQGKATLNLTGPYHPLAQRMMDCQMAAYAQAKKATEAKRELDSLWTRHNLTFPMTPDQKTQFEVIEKTVY